MNALVRGLSAAFLLFACAPASGQTTTTISNLPAASTPLSGAEALPCVQSGVTKKCTASSLGSGGTPGNPTATIGASPVNGVSTAYMRADAAPPLPAILPALDASLLTNLNASAISSGAVPAANLPLATLSAFGAVKPDGSTITISGGVISSVGGGATGANPTATIGATAVNGVSTSFMRADAAPPLPATLPALSGVNLTALNASNLGSGTVSTARGGLGADNSGASGVPLFAAGVNTMTATTGTGNVVRATSPTIASPTFSGTVAGAGTVPLSILATQAADTVVMNASASTASPTALAVNNCANALTYSTSTHTFGCNVGGGTGTVTTITAGTGINLSSGATCTVTCTIALTTAVNAQTGTSYTFVAGDGGKLVTGANAGAQAYTLPQATGSFAAGWGTNAYNNGAGTLTITPTTSTIAGLTSLPLAAGQGVSLASDGTDYDAIVGLPLLAADTVLMNASAATKYPAATALTSCSAASSALTYNTTTHAFGCNTISGGGSVTTLTAGTNITFSSGATCTTTCTVNASGSLSATYTTTFTGNVSGNPSAVGLGLDLAAATFTDNNTAVSGTKALAAIHSVEVPTLAATNTGVITTHAATVYIAGAPTAGTNQTLSASSALVIATGNMAFLSSASNLNFYNVGGPGVTNREALNLGWTSNVAIIQTVKNGTGSDRNLQLTSGSAVVLDGGSSVDVNVAASTKIRFNSGTMFAPSFGSGFYISYGTNASATTPTIGPNIGSTNTGIGGTSGNLSLILNGVEIIRLTAQHFVLSGSATTAISNAVSATCTDHCNDNAGRFTIGATPNAVLTVTFANTWGTKPVCTATDETAAATMPVSAVSTTTVSFTKSATMTASDQVGYICVGTN